ncbi:MAG: patatin-like phospholipase family protein [Rhizobiaceae bacterium]|nr:patatin-like phospholipase family protein [Rhizobiaceae bacterium]
MGDYADFVGVDYTLAASSTPSVAVAFGCGGARGLAHIHIIEALDELGIRPIAIAGASIGSIMGAAMAAGMSGAEIRDYTLATVGNRPAVLNKMWSLRPVSVRSIRFGQFNLERILRAFLPPGFPENFSDLHIPLKVVTTDYYDQAEVVTEKGDLFPVLAASAAIPAMFMPVKVGQRVMIDGGIMNPVPYEHLTGLADIIIGIDVVGGPEGDGTHIPNRIQSLFGAGQLTMQSNIARKLRLQAPQIFLRPTTGRIGVLDFLKARDILAMSAGVKDELKFALDRVMTAKN